MIEGNNIDNENGPTEPVVVPLVERKGIGRNDPCPCGSGAKYKKCHQKADTGLMPVEMARLLKILTFKLNGITITQETLDIFPDEKEITITYDTNLKAWHIWPAGKQQPVILLPKKEPVVPTRKLIKLDTMF